VTSSDYPFRLCRLDAIEEGEGKSLELHETTPAGTSVRELVVLKWDGRPYGYLNSCPHLGIPLEMVPDRFVDAAGTHVICRTHGALFEPKSGYCVSGPCAGQSLTPLPLDVDPDGWVRLTAPLPPER
jgi:nitrite reductase/ring-hydroxylating ferredoxin subunit